MIKNALIIVPHSDDEINTIGPIIDQFTDNNIFLTVIFATNGDGKLKVANKRYKESLRVARLLKINKIIYLGYGDDYQGVHIYNCTTKVARSKAGFKETYCFEGKKEYCYEKYGKHHEYTIKNYESDLKSCIWEENADLIICIDCDEHPDHVCLSLTFDRVMGQLIKEKDYKPIVLKKYAYRGVWHGNNDYFSRPMLPTIVDSHPKWNYYPYKTNDFVKFAVNPKIYSLLFWRSIIFKALCAYQTQYAVNNFISIVNSDCRYAYRDTNNRCLTANIGCSSGDPSKINDFMLYDTNNVRDYDIESYNAGFWKPDDSDKDKILYINFQEEIIIKKIVIYFNADFHSSVKQIRIFVEDSYVKDIIIDSIIKEISFNEGISAQNLVIQLLDCYGHNYGINEVEVYDHNEVFPYAQIPFCITNKTYIPGIPH